MININCCDPVLIVNPQLYECALKSDWYVIDGEYKEITSSMKYDILHGEKVSKVLNVPYAKSLSQEYLNKFSRLEQEQMLKRLENFVDTTYLFNSKTSEAFHIYQFVPCGHCDACHSSLMNSYLQRCQFQQEQDKVPSYFVTLTYNDAHLPVAGDEKHTPVVNRRHIQLFQKRLSRILGVKLKYFCVSEYGHENGRPHYHMLIFGIPQNIGCSSTHTDYLVNKYVQYCWRESERHQHSLGYVTFDEYVKEYPKYRDYPADYDKLSFGFTNVSICENASTAIAYCCKYLFKDVSVDDNRESFKSISCNMGLQFAKFLSEQPFVDGKFSYRPMDSLEPKQISLCGYYLKKLYPSLSNLVPVDVRRAVVNLNDAFFTMQNLKISKNMKSLLYESYKSIKSRFQFLFDFVKPPIIVSHEKTSTSLTLNLFELSHETFTKSCAILDAYDLDYSKLLEDLKKRATLFKGFKPRSREQILDAAHKFRKDMKVQESISTI